MAKKLKTLPWDAASHLATEADMAAYLEAALEEGDRALIGVALRAIARAKGMPQITRDTGLGRERLYQALSPDGNPEFATILKVVNALGFKRHESTGAAKLSSPSLGWHSCRMGDLMTSSTGADLHRFYGRTAGGMAICVGGNF